MIISFGMTVVLGLSKCHSSLTLVFGTNTWWRLGNIDILS